MSFVEVDFSSYMSEETCKLSLVFSAWQMSANFLPWMLSVKKRENSYKNLANLVKSFSNPFILFGLGFRHPFFR